MHPGIPAIFARPIAHRGFHDRVSGRIENSRSAFDAAVAGGYGIECDVQPSADGEAMVFHDYTLDRLTAEKGNISARHSTELADIRLTGSEDRIAPLTALLALVAGRVPLVVEVKSRFDGKTALASRVAQCVAGYAGPLAIKSFDPAMIARLRQLGCPFPLGIVGMAEYAGGEFSVLSPEQGTALATLAHRAETRPDFLSWRQRDLPLAETIRQGLPMMSWTIRNQKDADKALGHVSQIVFEGFIPAPR